jgi:hypothetical protein
VTYTTIEAARLAGVTVRQIRHWADCGYLRPERHNGKGHGGVVFSWDTRDVTDAAILGAVSAALGHRNLLQSFAYSLATKHSARKVGILIDTGAYTVTVEVRALREVRQHGNNGTTT